MHWGDVNSSEISEYQRNITAFLVENGVDMILGSHPSVVEPMEIIQTEEGKNVLGCILSWKLHFHFKICKCRCRTYSKHSNCKEFRLRQGNIAKS